MDGESLSTRFQSARSVDDLRWMEHFRSRVGARHYRDKAEAAQVAVTAYNEFCARFIRQSNVAAWLRKHRRTPEIVLLHGEHDIGMSISFRIPAEDEPVLLAWDLKPYNTTEWARPTWARADPPGRTFLRTTKELRTNHGPGGGSVGGSLFAAQCDPTNTAYDVYLRERDAGAEPDEAARTAADETLTPAHRYAPSTVEINCWCGKQRTTYWSLVLKNIERTTRPGHMRIENKRIVTTLPFG